MHDPDDDDMPELTDLTPPTHGLRDNCEWLPNLCLLGRDYGWSLLFDDYDDT